MTHCLSSATSDRISLDKASIVSGLAPESGPSPPSSRIGVSNANRVDASDDSRAGAAGGAGAEGGGSERADAVEVADTSIVSLEARAEAPRRMPRWMMRSALPSPDVSTRSESARWSPTVSTSCPGCSERASGVEVVAVEAAAVEATAAAAAVAAVAAVAVAVVAAVAADREGGFVGSMRSDGRLGGLRLV